jgi:hypothetical protein
MQEFGLENIKPSIRIEYKNLQKAHDTIHEFMLLAPLMFTSKATKEISWHRKSAFFVYHWEAFHHAHRSLIEALCAYYNIAFVLLRTTLEILIKGAFWECLSHKSFREESKLLDKDKYGRKYREWLEEIFKLAPDVQEEFETISVSIFDKISPIIEDPDFRIRIKIIVQQLTKWGIFNPIPNPIVSIYKDIYQRLSADVHIIPDRIDIGKRILNTPNKIFDQKVFQKALSEYTHYLHKVMDSAIVIELNIMKDIIKKYEEAKINLEERLKALDQLGLRYSLTCAKKILNE